MIKKFEKLISFFDPPYKDEDFLEHLQFIQKLKIYRKNHLVIIHREKTVEDFYLDPLSLLLLKIMDVQK